MKAIHLAHIQICTKMKKIYYYIQMKSKKDMWKMWETWRSTQFDNYNYHMYNVNICSFLQKLFLQEHWKKPPLLRCFSKYPTEGSATQVLTGRQHTALKAFKSCKVLFTILVNDSEVMLIGLQVMPNVFKALAKTCYTPAYI